MVVDCRDESTTDVRIVIELKRGADPQLVMAFLFKNTALATTVQFNMTCLVPTENPRLGHQTARPARDVASLSTSASKWCGVACRISLRS